MTKKLLRRGITTGSCAAAAARAAAVLLLSGQKTEEVVLRGPRGDEIRVPINRVEMCSGGRSGMAIVVKDAGDDPDVTDGASICVTVSVGEPDPRERKLGYQGEIYPRIFLTGGQGIGIVSRPGLSCPQGRYAVNPVPRRMVEEAVGSFCMETDSELFLTVRIEIPDGERLSLLTFNPNLGILGGLSVLGTSGIVEPMSEAALLETIRLEIHMKVLEGQTVLIMAPGNYGENFVEKHLGLCLKDCVRCSNFVGDTVAMMISEGVRQILFVGHIGKLIKVAAGRLNTHSRYGDGRMESLADCAGAAGVQGLPIEKIRSANTTEEAVAYLNEMELLYPVMDRVTERIKGNLEALGDLSVEVVTFSTTYGILGMTKGAETLCRALTEGEI